MGQRMVESPKTPRPRHALTPTANGTDAQQRAEEDKKWEEPRIFIERAAIPGEPVNAFGIPQATMRCLELAESVAQMADLIGYSNDQKLGPIEALSKYANKLRESQPQNGLMGNLNHNIGAGGSNFTNFQNVNGVSTTPAVTLYSQSANPPLHHQVASTSSPPKNQTASADNSPSKQNKPPPLSQASGSAPSGAPATPAAGSGSSSHNTPHLANASLKRKQSDIASPTVTTEQPPPKRVTRKRGRTNG